MDLDNNIYIKFLTIIILMIPFNSLWYSYILKKTKYEKNTQNDSDIGYLPIFVFIFGPLCLLFTKKIKIYRKHKYLKNRISYYNFINSGFYNEHDIVKSHHNKYTDPLLKEQKRLERIYKLSKIKQKSKRNKIKKSLWLM